MPGRAGAVSYTHLDVYKRQSQHLVKLNKNSLACVLGAAIMGVLLTIAEKKKIRWLNEWALTIAILASMAITVLV